MDTKEKPVLCMFPARVPKEGLEALPLTFYAGKVFLIDTNEVAGLAVAEILREKILGFDTESRPSFKKNQNYPVSIIQFCGEKCVWIFKLASIQESLGKVFSILEDSKIKKVGVAVKGDISALKKVREFNPAGFEDISEKTRKIGIVNTGLRNLAAVFLGSRISKSSQMSNWAAEKLTQKQIIYAATDAWISRELYLIVKKIYEEKLYKIGDFAPTIPLESRAQKILSRILRLLRLGKQ